MNLMINCPIIKCNILLDKFLCLGFVLEISFIFPPLDMKSVFGDHDLIYSDDLYQISPGLTLLTSSICQNFIKTTE